MFLVGCILPYAGVQLHSEMAKLDPVTQSIISIAIGTLCAMITAMMILIERIKRPFLRNLALWSSIVLIAVLICIALMFVFEAS